MKNLTEENVLILIDMKNYKFFSLLKRLKGITRKSFVFVEEEFVGA